MTDNYSSLPIFHFFIMTPCTLIIEFCPLLSKILPINLDIVACVPAINQSLLGDGIVKYQMACHATVVIVYFEIALSVPATMFISNFSLFYGHLINFNLLWIFYDVVQEPNSLMPYCANLKPVFACCCCGYLSTDQSICPSLYQHSWHCHIGLKRMNYLVHNDNTLTYNNYPETCIICTLPAKSHLAIQFALPITWLRHRPFTLKLQYSSHPNTRRASSSDIR